MPWKELTALDIRIEMINEYLSEDYSVTELCQRHEINRKTFYKWLEWYQIQGSKGWENGHAPAKPVW